MVPVFGFQACSVKMVGYISLLVLFFFLIVGPVFESKMKLGLLAHVSTVMYLFHVNEGKAVVSYVEIQKEREKFLSIFNHSFIT